MKNGAERIVSMMREQGAHKNPETMKVGTVKGADINIGSLTLSKGDYYINSDITLSEGDEVACIQLNDEYYVILCKVVK